MTRDRKRSEGGDQGAVEGSSERVPGKSTRSGKIQRRAADGAEPAADALAGRSLSGGGAALPDGVRDRFEGSLGADLSGVRVHTGGESAAAAQSLNAQAFAVGNDIHFGAGRYQPEDPFGMHLLAHEVAHTQQQAGGSTGAQLKDLDVSSPGDASEHEADRAAASMVRGEPATVSSAAPAVQRSDEEEATSAPAAAAPLAKPSYLESYLLGRAFPWDLLPAPKVLTATLIKQWIDFYRLLVYGMPDLDNPLNCNFNGATTNVNAVVSLFMKDAKAAGFRSDPYGAYHVISEDQKAKREANEKKWKDDQGKGGGGGGPGEKDSEKKSHETHAEIEWEFTPITAKKTWGGETEVEGPKHHFKGVLVAKVREIGNWKAEASGSVVVEFEGGHLDKIATEAEGKLSYEFLKHVAELEIVGKFLVTNEAKLREGKPAGTHISSSALHVEPSAEVNVVYEIPGTKGKLKIKGGVSADPEGISAGASFSVSWD